MWQPSWTHSAVSSSEVKNARSFTVPFAHASTLYTYDICSNISISNSDGSSSSSGDGSSDSNTSGDGRVVVVTVVVIVQPLLLMLYEKTF